jgi:hypothetical protein
MLVLKPPSLPCSAGHRHSKGISPDAPVRAFWLGNAVCNAHDLRRIMIERNISSETVKSHLGNEGSYKAERLTYRSLSSFALLARFLPYIG